jgi:dTDP-4-amino-4,6-dideoxygalactose transaminase
VEGAIRVSANYITRHFDKARTEAILDEVRALVASGDFTLGAPLKEFEWRFANLVGGREVIAVNSGTEALILGLKTLGIGPGDGVIVPVNAFYADAGAVVAVGATPIFCDVDASHQLDPLSIPVPAHARAILPVWWYGIPPDLDQVCGYARTHGLAVLEDAAQAVGGALGNRRAGTWGDVAAFSFHPIKPLHVWGDGGAVVLDPGERADWLRRYRDHGKLDRDTIEFFGINARMQTIQAVVANAELSRVGRAVGLRRALASELDLELAKIPGLTIPPRRGLPAWRGYVIEAEDRDGLMARLTEAGIEVAVHYPTPLHMQPPGRALGYARGDFPVAERQALRQLTLPCHEFLTRDEVAYLLESIQAAV